MQFSDIVASLKLAAQNARNNVNARRAGSINKQFAGVPVPARSGNPQFLRGKSISNGGKFNPAVINLCGNLLIVGGMGAGKTSAALSVATYLADKGETFVNYDTTGDFIAKLYRGPARDRILNVMDARGEAYNVFADMDSVQDLAAFAVAFIPVSAHPNSESEFQRAAARELVTGVAGLTVDGARTNEAFCTYLFDTPGAQLAALLEGTPAAKLLTALEGQGALYVAREALRGMRYLKSGDFSLRAALSTPDTRVFIGSSPDYAEMLSPLNSFLLSRVIELRTRMRAAGNPLPVVMDEFGSLAHAPAYMLAAAAAPDVQFVVCVQALDQLTRKFGAAGAKDLRCNLRNTLICRLSDDVACEAISKSFGSSQVVEVTSTQVFSEDGADDESYDSVSVKERRLVLPEEIRHLPDSYGYLQLAGSDEVALVSVPYAPSTRIAAPFVPREDLFISVK